MTVYAVFDFDKTITNRDSFIPFLIFCTGYKTFILKSMILLPALFCYAFNQLSRQEMKEKTLTLFFKGMPIETLKKLAQDYSKNQLNQYLKSEALHRLGWHKSQGHRCFLVSASLEIYLIPWAARYGFDSVLATKLELTESNRVTGKIQGKNCWGEEKKRRLLEQITFNKDSKLYVYGDSQGDRELLELADFPYYRQFSATEGID